MTPVTIAINLVVFPLLVVVLAAWCAIVAGLLRKLTLWLRRIWQPNWWQTDFRCFFKDIGTSMRSYSVVQTFGAFYYRPIEGMLIWVPMVVSAFCLMAIWSAAVVALVGHYP